jgi:alkylation response protein AidB-like acyl-CoA dehydrogenase
MEFAWRPDQIGLHEAAARLGRERLGQHLAARDRDQVFDAAGWLLCAESGATGLTVPACYGGRELDSLTAARVLEGLGYGCRDNGLMMALGAHLWGCVQPIAIAGTEAQKERFLPRLCAGAEIGALAATEPEAGSDIAAIATRAELHGDDYVLNGRKVLVTNAPLAGVLVVLAATDPARAGFGLTCFIVEGGTPGLTLAPNEAKMGMRTAALGEVTLRDCAVPAANRLGAEGAGLAIFHRTMAWERGMILAPAVGTMQRLLEQCCEHARTRRQFGAPIGQFQHVSGRLVEMQMRLETARAVLYRAAWLKAEGRPSDRESALAKLHISEAWVRSCEDAMQIFGGAGYLAAGELERELRDSLGSRLYSGSSDTLKALLARQLLARQSLTG